MAKGKKGKGKPVSKSSSSSEVTIDKLLEAASLSKGSDGVVVSPYACTGALRKLANWWDIIIDSFSLSFNGIEIISETTLQLSSGRRYGLIGPNGSGKSTLLNAIGCREAPMPEHVDIYHLRSEIAASDMSAIDSVLAVDDERAQIEAEAHKLGDLLAELDGEEAEAVNTRMCEMYDRLEELGANTAKTRAAKILSGLGFTPAMQEKATKDFSGGWRMRIALARALFIKPTLLLLDEPTNHLDMEACVWLEMYFRSWNPKGILVVVSHSQDFLNGVCTNIITLSNKKLQYYSGNYDQYVQTRMEKEENQMKNYKWEQDQIKHMKDYIARFGHGSAKLARQAKSKEKTLARMESKGLTEVVRQEKKVLFSFPDCENLSPPVLVFQSVSFAYPGCPYLYKNLDFGIDLDSRIALVGPNGVGKTSLLKLMVGQSCPTDGQVSPHNKLRIAWYNQHTVDQLDMELSPLRYMRNLYPEEGEETVRSWLGRFGVTGASQTQKMRYLSDGQKSRVVFCYMAQQHPHILLLDEPTNHLDMESIDALADAINDFNGGVVLVSHDMRLILQVADELWVCNNKTITRWEGDIISYKQTLLDEIYAQNLLDGDLANI